MTTDRAGYINGLRALADLLEEHPEIPLPHVGRAAHPITIYSYDLAEIDAFVAAAGPVHLDAETHMFHFIATVGGLTVAVSAPPRLVAEKVPVESTVTREEWRLKPGVLRGASTSQLPLAEVAS